MTILVGLGMIFSMCIWHAVPSVEWLYALGIFWIGDNLGLLRKRG